MSQPPSAAGWSEIARLGSRAGGKAKNLARVAALLAKQPGCSVLPAVWLGPRGAAATAARAIVRALRGHEQLIVRSTATIEDGRTASLAGHFETQLCDASPAALARTIAAVRAESLKAWPTLLRRRGESRARALARGRRQLGLLIQPALCAERSGVLFSASPTHPGRAMIVATYGSCHGVVDGSVATDTFVLEPTGGTAERRLGYKFEMVWRAEGPCGQPLRTPLGPSWLHLPYGPKLSTARVPRGLEALPALSDAQLTRVHQLGVALEAAFGFPIDLEFSFVGDELFVLQARAITTAPTRLPDTAAHGGPQIASPGRASGPLRRVWTVDDLAQVRHGDIALVAATDPEFLPMFRKVAGILSVEGSALTHTAIVARELGLPCLVGVDEATDGPFVEGAVVTVDAIDARVVHAKVAKVRVPPARPRRSLTASHVIAEVAHALGDWTPGPDQLALARRLVGRRRVTWDCAATDSTAERTWRAFFEGRA